MASHLGRTRHVPTAAVLISAALILSGCADIASADQAATGRPGMHAQAAAAPAKCNRKQTQPAIWYDKDQYGTHIKIQGRMRNCPGPKALRIQVSCPVGGSKSTSKTSTSGAVSTLKTSYIAAPGKNGAGTACPGRVWLAKVTGSYDTDRPVSRNYFWIDWGYPA